MGLLIDSSVLISLERRGLPIDTLRREGPAAISTVTASELLVGLHRARTPAQRTQRQTFINSALETLAVLPFDLVIAEVHAKLWAELSRSGQLIGIHDMLIAATALANEFAILTENVREFSRIPGLEVRQPAW